MTIYDIEKMAKLVMEKRGCHKAQIIIPGAEGLEIGVLLFEDEDEKIILREKMRELVINRGVDHYFFITEAWLRSVDLKNPSTPFIRPKDLKDRQEAIVINEYRKDMTGKQILLYFEKKGKKITWLERKESTNNNSPSMWNFFINKDCLEERFEKVIEEEDEAFLKKMSKEYSKKYYPKFQACNNDDERKAVFIEMINEMKGKKEEIMNLKRKEGDS